MVDNEHSIESKKQRMQVIYKFLDQMFSNREKKSEYCWDVIAPQPEIDWPYFERVLSHEQLCSFRSISRIAYYLPHEPFYELMQGYEWDIAARCVQDETDLIEYSKYVASSVATLCTFVFCHKSYQWPDRMGPKCRSMLESARKMGLVCPKEMLNRKIIMRYRNDVSLPIAGTPDL